MLTLLRQIKWLAIWPHLIVFALFIALLRVFGLGWDMAPWLGALLYLGLSVLLQNIIPHHHRSGMKALQNEDYELARQAFSCSYDYFKQHAWLDDYRSFFILSISNMSYKEMALINYALCYFQEDRWEEARSAYERVLSEYPNSRMAQDAIDYINNPDPEEEEEEELY